MTGRCIGEEADALVASASEPGTPINVDFAQANLDGVELSSLPAELWANYWISSSSTVDGRQCPSDNYPRSGSRGTEWRWVDIEDPRGSALQHFADIEQALEAEGWETSHHRQRATTPGEPDQEHRMFRALRDDSGIVMIAVIQAEAGFSQRNEFVEYRGSVVDGACVSEFDLESLHQLSDDWEEVEDPLAFTPLIEDE